MLRQEERLLLRFTLRFLTLARRRIMAHTYGLLDQRELSSAEIADATGVSKGRVWQQHKCSLSILQDLVVRDEDWGFAVRPGLGSTRHTPVFRRADPPPPLSRRDASAVEAERWPCWQPLPRPLAPRALLPLVAALLARLGLSQDVVRATPTFKSWLAMGVPQGEARWQARTLEIALLREGHAERLHEGGERVVTQLTALLGMLPQATQVVFQGRLGALERFAVLGARPAAVLAALRAVLPG